MGETAKPRLIAGIGASAGGIQACKALLDRAPGDSGIAWIVVLHLDPTRASHIAEILQQHSRLQVAQASGSERLKPDHVYVIAPNSELQLKDGVLNVDVLDALRPRSQLADLLFESLAAAEKERAVGVVLSGAGSDGCAGLKRIHAAGGLCLAQAPASALATGMPQAAIDAGVVDGVLEPEEMPAVLMEFAQSGKRPRPTAASGAGPDGFEVEKEESDMGFDRILDLLRAAVDVDFDDYKTGTLQRRTLRRMSLKGIPSWKEYADFLEKNAEEVHALYGDVLIGVTEFFRDPPVWEQLAKELPGLIEARDDPGLRAWVPACGTGEEAYSLAMLAFEVLPASARNRIQIYATDLDERALQAARRGIYSMQHLVNVTQERRGVFFRHHDDELQIDPRVRDCVTFSPHNALADPPFSKMDVVSCRNLLIYLNQQAHDRLLKRFHFALRTHGLLVLGRAETLGKQTPLFEDISRNHGIYRARRARNAYNHQITTRPTERLRGMDKQTPVPRRRPRETRPDRRIEQFVLSQRTPASVAVNADLQILHFYGQTQHYLVPPTGETRQDLLAWIRPGFYIRLRSAAKRSIETKQVVTTEGQIQRDGAVHRVQCAIEPLASAIAADNVWLITFRDVGGEPAQVEHADEGEPLARELEQELVDTRHELLAAVEQLEAAGEEHRASHEELLSLNEELQSSNEELEASKEELEALNEEMNTINRELEDKNTDLRAANADLNNLFQNTGIPTIFLDKELNIRRFTPTATDVMRLVPSDAGRSISHVRERFDEGDTASEARAVLESRTPSAREVWTENGRCYRRQLLPYRNYEQDIDGVCITFTDVTEQKQAAIASEAARRYAESVIRHVRTPLMVIDQKRCIATVNPAFRTTFGDERRYEGDSLDDCADCRWNVEGLREPLEEVISDRTEVRDLEVTFADGIFLVNMSVIHQLENGDLFLVSFEDVTRDRRAREAAAERQKELAKDASRKDQWIAMLGHELRNPIGAISNGITLLKTDVSAERRESLHEMLHRQTRQISRLLDDLLDAGRVIAGKLQIGRDPVDVAQVARWALETLGPQIEERKHELVPEVPDEGGIWIEGDGNRLNEVITNLLSNAAKYTAPGGRIGLHIAADEQRVSVTVADNGAGIEPEFMPHIFDVFSQGPRGLDRSSKGLGLGLPLVRNIVELHGGTVEAFSEGRDKGSRFVVTLPRMRYRPKRKRDRQAKAPSRRILIVDDEPDGMTSQAALLEARGHTVRAVRNGEDALEVATAFRPEVVLLDLGMPGMNGYDLAKNLRTGGSDALLIAISGYRQNASLQEGAGIDHHLTKPVDQRRLQALLAEHPDVIRRRQANLP